MSDELHRLQKGLQELIQEIRIDGHPLLHPKWVIGRLNKLLGVRGDRDWVQWLLNKGASREWFLGHPLGDEEKQQLRNDAEDFGRAARHMEYLESEVERLRRIEAAAKEHWLGTADPSALGKALAEGRRG